MKPSPVSYPGLLFPLIIAWLGLVSLTLVSLGLGEWLHNSGWLPLLVASIIWFKAWLIGRYFLEAHLSRTFIRRLVSGFIAFAPIALVLTDFFGSQFVAWIDF